MPVREYVSNKEQLLMEGQMIVSSCEDALFQHKVEMVNLVLSGIMPSTLSKYCGDSKNAITMWVKAADEKGFDSLKTKKKNGRPMKLNKEQLEEIKNEIKKDNPKELGYSVWDGPTLSEYIKQKYDVSLSVRQCQRLLHILGFSLVRPRLYPAKDLNNEKEREELKKN